ncbi:hypothetical protein BT69DRAFT_1301328 [Atractiella rhizophila]|nr:hypothetical protein BT69DRAFT_1301328 [Atractiella rhizophila]
MEDAEWRQFADLYRMQTGEQAPIRGEHKWAIGDAIQRMGADLRCESGATKITVNLLHLFQMFGVPPRSQHRRTKHSHAIYGRSAQLTTSFLHMRQLFYLPIEIDDESWSEKAKECLKTMMLWGYIVENAKGEVLMVRPVRELYKAAGPSQAILFSKENSAWLKGDWAASAFLKALIDNALKEVIKAKELKWSDEENTAHMIWKLLQSKCTAEGTLQAKTAWRAFLSTISQPISSSSYVDWANSVRQSWVEIERYAGKITGPDKIISLHLLSMIPESLSIKWETSFKVLQERHELLHPGTPIKIEHISPDTIVEEISGIVGRESLAQDGDRAFLMQRSDGTGGSINNVHPSRCGFVEASSRFSRTCDHCKKKGHKKAECFQLHPENTVGESLQLNFELVFLTLRRVEQGTNQSHKARPSFSGQFRQNYVRNPGTLSSKQDPSFKPRSTRPSKSSPKPTSWRIINRCSMESMGERGASVIKMAEKLKPFTFGQKFGPDGIPVVDSALEDRLGGAIPIWKGGLGHQAKPPASVAGKEGAVMEGFEERMKEIHRLNAEIAIQWKKPHGGSRLCSLRDLQESLANGEMEVDSTSDMDQRTFEQLPADAVRIGYINYATELAIHCQIPLSLQPADINTELTTKSLPSKHKTKFRMPNIDSDEEDEASEGTTTIHQRFPTSSFIPNRVHTWEAAPDERKDKNWTQHGLLVMSDPSHHITSILHERLLQLHKSTHYFNPIYQIQFDFNKITDAITFLPRENGERQSIGRLKLDPQDIVGREEVLNQIGKLSPKVISLLHCNEGIGHEELDVDEANGLEFSDWRFYERQSLFQLKRGLKQVYGLVLRNCKRMLNNKLLVPISPEFNINYPQISSQRNKWKTNTLGEAAEDSADLDQDNLSLNCLHKELEVVKGYYAAGKSLKSGKLKDLEGLLSMDRRRIHHWTSIQAPAMAGWVFSVLGSENDTAEVLDPALSQ